MSNAYNSGIKAVQDGTIAWASADIRVALVTSSYTFADTHDDMADITNELSGGGYARVALSGKATVLNDAGHGSYCDASDTVFPALGAAAGTPAKAIVYLYNASDASAQLICCVTLTTPPTPNGADYKLVWSATGIVSGAN